jgi:hypothetical protein
LAFDFCFESRGYTPYNRSRKLGGSGSDFEVWWATATEAGRATFFDGRAGVAGEVGEPDFACDSSSWAWAVSSFATFSKGRKNGFLGEPSGGLGGEFSAFFDLRRAITKREYGKQLESMQIALLPLAK